MSWLVNDDGEPECPVCIVAPCWGRETKRAGVRVWYQCRRCGMDFWVEDS